MYERCDVTEKSASQPEPPSPPRAGAMDWLMTRAAASLGRFVPPVVPALNRMGQGLPLFRPRTRVGRSDLILNGPMAPKYHETEYGLPLEAGSEAMGAYREIVQREPSRPELPGDDPLRPGRRPVAEPGPRPPHHLHQHHRQPRTGLRARPPGAGADVAQPGRPPPLGKLFSATPADLARAYPTYYDRFRTLMARMDPAGVFRNTLLDSLFPRR